MVIFVSSIGRSGTRFIASLFDACTDIPSFHALEPHCHGDNMATVLNGESCLDLEKKIQVIKKHVKESEAYFESTQLFNRILFDAVTSNFEDVRMIQLLRDPLEVARSYVNRDSYPGRADRPWRVPLNNPKSKFIFPLDDLNPFQLNLCDWLDNELLFQDLQQKVAKTYPLQFRDFANPEAMVRLFQELQLPFDEKKLNHIFAEQSLDKNENKIKTTLSKNDIDDAQTLLNLLHKETFPTETFKSSIYQAFSFLQALVNAPHQLEQKVD